MAPTFRHGRSVRVCIDQHDMSPILNSVNQSASADAAEVTSFGQDDRAYIPGLRTGTVSFEGLGDFSSEEKDSAFDGELGSTDKSVISWFPNGFTAGNLGYLASGCLTARGLNTPFDGAVSASVDYEVSGGIRQGNLLTSTATQATATTWASVNMGGTTHANGAVGHLHVLAATTSGSGVVARSALIQDSSNDSVWADLITFTDVASTAPQSSYERVSATGTVSNYVRARVDTQGSTAVSYIIALGRNP